MNTLFDIGDRVKDIKANDEKDKRVGSHPSIGTLGTVVNFSFLNVTCPKIRVRWDDAIGGIYFTWCNVEDVVEAESPYDPSKEGFSRIVKKSKKYDRDDKNNTYERAADRLKSSDILHKLCDAELEVAKDMHGMICVKYKGAEVANKGMLLGVCGRGITFELACTDYLEQIRGKKLVFDAYGNYRKEIMISQ